MYEEHDTSIEANNLCQTGLNSTDITTYASLFDAYISEFKKNFFGSTNKRRRRTVTVLTCDSLRQMSALVSSLTVSQIGSISSSEFALCQTYLGTFKTWSSSQLTALADQFKKVIICVLGFSKILRIY